jgi:molybdopterin-containing oxidoreductase family iron-sulfur binding subunit
MSELKNKLNGKEYWRSIDQLADTPQFKKLLENEFPESVSEIENPVSRRKFLGLMGASLAFAGLVSCRRPVEKIVPYVQAPENIIPGVPKFYATTATIGAYAYGLLVESHEGRPTKIEGNEKHPATMGKSNAFLQAEILNLYDPDRAKNLSYNGNSAEWNEFVNFWDASYKSFVESRGKGLAVVSGEFASPTLYKLYTQFKKTFPNAIWVVDETVSNVNCYDGIADASGENVRPKFHFDKANVVLSIDNDFLGSVGDSIANNAGFAKARRVESEKDSMNRLYIVESSFSITGGMADHRKQLSQGQIEAFTFQLAAALGIIESDALVVDTKWLSALINDLKKNKGAGIVVAGYRQSAAVHTLVYAINASLGNNNTTITYHKNEYALLKDASLKTLSENSADINTLITLNSNIIYSAPADLKIKSVFEKIENKICF